ncbi:MAG TPA: alpha/beta fold hydrolase [Kofleriaceae bacterium]|jgi:pimeloyl-ACP methyl ester carboxylesterase|nr:alpha/beta fold hydrolase [Kofleriaceae bacterium]
MIESLPILLVPGLLATPQLYASQLPMLWRLGPVMVADTTRGTSIADLAHRILEEAPPRFALIGLSMGGYLAFEILRQAPARVLRLAVLDTSARPDTPEAIAMRRQQIEQVEHGSFAAVIEALYPRVVHPSRLGDAALRQIFDQMAVDVGPEAFIRQQGAIMGRPDSRPGLAAIRCPTLVVVGDADALTPPELADEIAAAIPGARRATIADCGHLSTLEQPQAVNTVLESWLRGG